MWQSNSGNQSDISDSLLNNTYTLTRKLNNTYTLTHKSSDPSSGIVYCNYIPLSFPSSISAFAAAIPSAPDEICLGTIDDMGGSIGYAGVFGGPTFGLAH